MRQLTAYASYLDNLGTPLVGRARFYNFDDSPAVVYGLDNAHQNYIQLGHIVYTNSSGQLVPQVFLADHDYLVVFDKYIGDGTMSEDDNPESWQEMGSAVDRYNTLGITLDGSSVRSVGTVSALRNLAPVGDTEVITLLGYNTAGDKPSIDYRWDPYSTESDNGGSVIKVGSIATGRWKFIECPRYLDVRHFGAFPLTGSVEDTVQRYSIQRAGAYAHTNGCGIYFWGSPTNAYYDITDLGLFDVDSNDYASVFAIKGQDDEPGTVRASINTVKNVLCQSTENIEDQGLIQLYDKTLRTSYAPAYNVRLVPARNLIVDAAFSSDNRTFNDVIVLDYVGVDSSWTFTDCIMVNATEYVRLGNYIVKRGHNEDPSYDTLTLKDISGNGIFEVRGSIPHFLQRLWADAGIRIDTNDRWDFVNDKWMLYATALSLVDGMSIDTYNYWSKVGSIFELHAQAVRAPEISSARFIGQVFEGPVKPVTNTSYARLDLINTSASADYSDSTTVDYLPDGCLAYLLCVYETAGGYITGTFRFTNINKNLNVSITGSDDTPAVHLPIERWNILIPVMRVGNSLGLGMPRRIDVPRNSSDTDLGCHISLYIS